MLYVSERMRYFPAKEIRPKLFIGSEGDSQNPDFMRDNDIGFVVNCSRNIPFLELPGVEYYRIPIDDDKTENDVLLSHLPIVVRAIDVTLSRGKGVLVHCRAGMSRSASTVAGYLMYKYGLPAKNAIASIKDRKKETFWPMPVFASALSKYEKQLAMFKKINNASDASNNTTL